MRDIGADRFVERMGGALTDAGLARLPSRVFAALLVDPDGRMTSAELVEQLQVSPAAVSGAVKYLGSLQFLRREREPGSRRDVYVVDDDAWHEATMRRDSVYAPILRALDEAVDEQPTDNPAHHRLWLTAEFLRFLDSEMRDIAVRWETRKAQLEREH